jgi:cytochrome d ubiquinol oxidase subunit I
MVMYFAVFGSGVTYMLKLVGKGPEDLGYEKAPRGGDGLNQRPARPLSSAPDMNPTGNSAEPIVHSREE